MKDEMTTSSSSRMTSLDRKIRDCGKFLSEWEVKDVNEVCKLDLKPYFIGQKAKYKRCYMYSEQVELEDARVRAEAHIAVDLKAMQTWMVDKMNLQVPPTPKKVAGRRNRKSLANEVESTIEALIAMDFLSIDDDLVYTFRSMIGVACKISTEFRDLLIVLSDAAQAIMQSPVVRSSETNKENRGTRTSARKFASPVARKSLTERSQENAPASSSAASSVAGSSVTLDDDNMSMYRSASSVDPDSQPQSARVSVEKEADTAKDGLKAVWMHRERLSEADAAGKCFVCRLSVNVEGEQLEQCSKKHEKSTRCPTMFHASCLKSYNAAEYSSEYLKFLTGLTLCPLHHCNLCWFERKKSTAILGNLLQCTGCYRSFHDVCRPAGSVVEKTKVTLSTEDGTQHEIRMERVTCHSHCPDVEKWNPRSHLSFCCECEEMAKPKERLENCSQCIRSFHKECRTVGSILGNPYGNGLPLCESCIQGESIRIGQKVIAKYQNSFFPCEAVSLDNYPVHCKAYDKHGKSFGVPGYVAVSWSGCQNLFSLLPARRLVAMFEGSFGLIGKRMTDDDIYMAWRRMEVDIEIPRPKFNLVGEKYQKIKTSIYHPDFHQKPRLEAVEEHEVMCDCPPGGSDRCGPNAKCTNRSVHQECPEACERVEGGCQNRWISRKEHHPHIEMREADGKGQGVFATQLIPKGSFIAEYAGELISVAEKNRRIALSAKSRNDEEKHYMMELDSWRIIDCKHKGNIARFLNHSCDPNCVVEQKDAIVATNKTSKSCFIRYDRRASITALREILPGEELCFNYDMKEFSVGCPLPECKCNSANCTGKLGRTANEKREASAQLASQRSRNGKESRESSVVSSKGGGSQSSKRRAGDTPQARKKAKKGAEAADETPHGAGGDAEETKKEERGANPAPRRKTSSSIARRANQTGPIPEGTALVPMQRGGRQMVTVAVPVVAAQASPPSNANNVFIDEARANNRSYIDRISENAQSTSNRPTLVEQEEAELKMFTPPKAASEERDREDEPPQPATAARSSSVLPPRTSRGRGMKKFSP